MSDGTFTKLISSVNKINCYDNKGITLEGVSPLHNPLIINRVLIFKKMEGNYEVLIKYHFSLFFDRHESDEINY